MNMLRSCMLGSVDIYYITLNKKIIYPIMSMAEPGPPSPSSASAQLATTTHAELGLGGPGPCRKMTEI